MAVPKHSSLPNHSTILIQKLRKVLSRRIDGVSYDEGSFGHQILEISKQVSLQQGRSNYLEKEIVELHKQLSMEKLRANELERQIVESLKQTSFEKHRANFFQKQMDDIKDEINRCLSIANFGLQSKALNNSGLSSEKTEDEVDEPPSKRIKKEYKHVIKTEVGDGTNSYKHKSDPTNDQIVSLDKELKCSICSATFTRKLQLSKHVKTVHTQPHSHKCEECDYSSSSKIDLKRHTKLHRNTQLFKCEQCSYSTERKSYFIRHIDIMHKNMASQNVGPGKCDQLPVEGPLAKSLSAFKDAITSNKKEIVELITPIKSMTGKKKRFSCSQCTEMFPSNKGLKHHDQVVHTPKETKELHTHKDTKNFACGKCEIVSKDKRELKRHLRAVHNAKMDYKCKMCNYITERKSYFDRHVEIMHRSIECL